MAGVVEIRQDTAEPAGHWRHSCRNILLIASGLLVKSIVYILRFVLMLIALIIIAIILTIIRGSFQKIEVPCNQHKTCSDCGLGYETWRWWQCCWSSENNLCYDPLENNTLRLLSKQCYNLNDSDVVEACPNMFRAPYNESTAVKALGLVAASNTDESCLSKCIASKNLISEHQVLRVFNFTCPTLLNPNSLCMTHVTFSNANKRVVITFPGSADPVNQLLEDLKSFFWDAPRVVRMGTNKTGKVLSYFYDGGNKAYQELINDSHITDLLKQNYSLWVVGYSLGGAFANVFLSLLANEDWLDRENVFLYTFGSPRVGDWQFTRTLELYFPNMYRVVHAHDIIPHLPFQWPLITEPAEKGSEQILNYLWKKFQIMHEISWIKIKHSITAIKWTSIKHEFFQYLQLPSIFSFNPCHGGQFIHYTRNFTSYQLCYQENDQVCHANPSVPWEDYEHHNYFWIRISEFCNRTCANQISDIKFNFYAAGDYSSVMNTNTKRKVNALR